MPFVVSAGQLTPTSGRLDLMHAPQRLMIGGFSQDYLEIWRRQYAVKTTISFLARNIAQLGLPVFRRVSDDERERLSDHPLARLLRQPNPYTTRYRFLDALIHDLGIFDLSYWLKVRGAAGGNGGIGLVRLPPAGVIPRGHNQLYPEWFDFRGTTGLMQFDAADVLFFRGYSGLLSDIGGVSPIESLREVLEESWWSSVGRSQVVRNGARVSGYLKRPPEAIWSDEARKSFKADWQSQYTAYGPGAGGTPILEDGMEFVPASMTPKDLQYVESRKLTREEVAAAYFVPPPMLGLLENATFSNITEQHLMLYQDTLGPWLSMVQDEIKLQLISEFSDGANIYCEFNMAEKLRGNFEARQAAIVQSVGGPYRTVNEGRALENLPPVADGDELIRPLNVTTPGDQDPIPAEEAPLMTPTPKPPPADEAKAGTNGHRGHGHATATLIRREGS